MATYKEKARTTVTKITGTLQLDSDDFGYGAYNPFDLADDVDVDASYGSLDVTLTMSCSLDIADECGVSGDVKKCDVTYRGGGDFDVEIEVVSAEG